MVAQLVASGHDVTVVDVLGERHEPETRIPIALEVAPSSPAGTRSITLARGDS